MYKATKKGVSGGTGIRKNTRSRRPASAAKVLNALKKKPVK